MTPFALVVRWSGQPERSEVDGLLDPIRSNVSEDTMCGRVRGAAFVVGLRSVFAGETVNWGFAVDEVRKRLIVGDVRLYARSNRRALADLPSDATDLAVVLSAYNRHGRDVTCHLVGDFSFVVWDWGTRTLFAARDHFGLKPLYYRALHRGMALAADPRQLFHIEEPTADIDSQSVLDYLLATFSHSGRTFFKDIRQVRPAHALTAGEGRVSQERYWLPRHETVGERPREDHVEGWRALLRTCVEERLSSAFPVSAHLSGGLDTGCMIRLAHDAYEDDRVSFPRFLALSALFPGLPCDETANISAIAQMVPRFEAVAWDGCLPNLADLKTPMLVAPGLRRGLGGGQPGDFQAAMAHGVRTILCGLGGDEIFRADGIFRDMVRGGRWFTFLREVAKLPSWARRRHVGDGLRTLVPAGLVDRTRRFRSAQVDRPEWLGPVLADFFPGEPDDRYRGDFEFESNLQRERWRVLTQPQLGTFVEFAVLAAREAGIEVRMPYLDVRLAEYVMAIPWHERLPRGDMRRLQRDGARQMLPHTVIATPKVTFESAFELQANLALPTIREVLYDQQWASGQFVNQRAARRLLVQIEENGSRATWQNRRYLWKTACLEVWLRAVGHHFAEYEGHHERFAEGEREWRNSHQYSLGIL
jgi:asparagine synthase (glutamine-hydrolysing)